MRIHIYVYDKQQILLVKETGALTGTVLEYLHDVSFWLLDLIKEPVYHYNAAVPILITFQFLPPVLTQLSSFGTKAVRPPWLTSPHWIHPPTECPRSGISR